MLIKHIVLLVAIFILSLSPSALAAELGVIEGRLVNESAGGSSVADQDVMLKTYLDNAEAGSTATKTDAEGKFEFNGLPTSSEYSYQVWLQYQEAEYTSEWLSFGEGETAKSVEVIVYDSTTSDEAIGVVTSHIIIYIEEGGLFVEEYYLFVNEGDRTYIGSKEVTAEGVKETLRFSLPQEANNLRLDLGLMDCCAFSAEEGFVDTMPALPGDKEAAYSYSVDYASETYTFSKEMYYPTADFVLLVQSEGIDVSSSQLTMGEPFDFEGMSFIPLSGENLAVGTPIVIHLSGLPKADNLGALIWVALALILLASGFGFGYPLIRKRLRPLSPVPESSPDQKKQSLLLEIAQLDDDFEGGKISEEVYQRTRSERKAQLVELMRRLKEERGNR